jgi:hypothetical protein
MLNASLAKEAKNPGRDGEKAMRDKLFFELVSGFSVRM